MLIARIYTLVSPFFLSQFFDIFQRTDEHFLIIRFSWMQQTTPTNMEKKDTLQK